MNPTTSPVNDAGPDSPDSFRDSIATVNATGQRVWIYPKKPAGYYYNMRVWLSYFQLLFLLGAPFVTINGQPFLLFNIIERKFIIFGQPFWPQDFDIFAVAFIAVIVFILLFTVVFGRIFCGWACPQTVFMEMLFRRIEYWIEGDMWQQRKLDKAPWTTEKFLKKFAKHAIFFALAFFIGNVFLAYIVGQNQLWKIITDPPAQHITGLSAMIIFSGIFYWVFAFFREQARTLVCPYGRLQSVLLDNESIIVHYDHKRGEPRAKFRKTETRADKGHCIECHACVDVCPTGIDIRNGTQLECINCTACMDACDSVMDKVNFPRKLIRYASFNGIEHGKSHIWNTRAKAYTAILFILVVFVAYLIFSRPQVEATILRTPGQLFQEATPGVISNLYNYKIANKTFNELPIQLKLLAPPGEIKVIGQTATVAPDGIAEGSFFVEIPTQNLYTTSTMIEIGVFSGAEQIEKIKTTFQSPGKPRN